MLWCCCQHDGEVSVDFSRVYWRRVHIVHMVSGPVGVSQWHLRESVNDTGVRIGNSPHPVVDPFFVSDSAVSHAKFAQSVDLPQGQVVQSAKLVIRSPYEVPEGPLSSEYWRTVSTCPVRVYVFRSSWPVANLEAGWGEAASRVFQTSFINPSTYVPIASLTEPRYPSLLTELYPQRSVTLSTGGPNAIDVTTEVQELLDDPSWSSGNYIGALVLVDSTAASSTPNGFIWVDTKLDLLNSSAPDNYNVRCHLSVTI